LGEGTSTILRGQRGVWPLAVPEARHYIELGKFVITYHRESVT
jgi:hypothetical protein